MRRRLAITAGVALLAVAGVAAKLTGDVHRQAFVDEARPADLIVVLGAAEYRGRPSPVLRARLDHGLDLWRRQLAPRILTTGGAGGDPVYTEGEVGRNYLMRHNVPAEAILVEPEASTTAESAVATAEIMRRMGLGSCMVVTDGYHIFRVKRMLERRGLRVYGSPRPGETRDSPRFWWLCARQAVGYLLWRVGIVI